MIDGLKNNAAPKDKKNHQKESVLAKLNEKKEEIARRTGQNSLNVTVCMIACTFYQGYFIHSLSTLFYYSAPSLATRLTGDYRDRT